MPCSESGAPAPGRRLGGSVARSTDRRRLAALAPAATPLTPTLPPAGESRQQRCPNRASIKAPSSAEHTRTDPCACVLSETMDPTSGGLSTPTERAHPHPCWQPRHRQQRAARRQPEPPRHRARRPRGPSSSRPRAARAPMALATVLYIVSRRSKKTGTALICRTRSEPSA